MNPSQKSPQIENLLENIFGVNRRQTIESDTCVSCKGEAKKFRDEISRREYSISGLCQSCQDLIFNETD